VIDLMWNIRFIRYINVLEAQIGTQVSRKVVKYRINVGFFQTRDFRKTTAP
jgi:hypothetical protein